MTQPSVAEKRNGPHTLPTSARPTAPGRGRTCSEIREHTSAGRAWDHSASEVSRPESHGARELDTGTQKRMVRKKTARYTYKEQRRGNIAAETGRARRKENRLRTVSRYDGKMSRKKWSLQECLSVRKPTQEADTAEDTEAERHEDNRRTHMRTTGEQTEGQQANKQEGNRRTNSPAPVPHRSRTRQRDQTPSTGCRAGGRLFRYTHARCSASRVSCAQCSSF